jgi:hypothetical protein
MNVDDAAYLIGQAYPGGAEALALRLGKPSLSDQLNPHHRAKLSVAEAVQIQTLTRDYRILYAMAAELQHFQPLLMPEALAVHDAPNAKLLAELAVDFGKLMGEVAESLADDEVKDNELRRIGKAWGELLQAGQALLGKCQATAGVRALRPRSPIRQAAVQVVPQPTPEQQPEAVTWRDVAQQLAQQGLLNPSAPAELGLVRKAVANARQAGELVRVGTRRVQGSCRPMAVYLRLAAELQPQRTLGFDLTQAWAA